MSKIHIPTFGHISTGKYAYTPVREVFYEESDLNGFIRYSELDVTSTTVQQFLRLKGDDLVKKKI